MELKCIVKLPNSLRYTSCDEDSQVLQAIYGDYKSELLHEFYLTQHKFISLTEYMNDCHNRIIRITQIGKNTNELNTIEKKLEIANEKRKNTLEYLYCLKIKLDELNAIIPISIGLEEWFELLEKIYLFKIRGDIIEIFYK